MFFFGEFKCSYKMFDHSIKSDDIGDEGFALGMLLKESYIELDKKQIINIIHNYIYSTPEKVEEHEKSLFIGADVIDSCINYLNEDNIKSLNFLRIIMEHKELMLERLIKINANEQIVNEYTKIVELSKIMWNCVLKYNIANSKKILLSIIDKLQLLKTRV